MKISSKFAITIPARVLESSVFDAALIKPCPKIYAILDRFFSAVSASYRNAKTQFANKVKVFVDPSSLPEKKDDAQTKIRKQALYTNKIMMGLESNGNRIKALKKLKVEALAELHKMHRREARVQREAAAKKRQEALAKPFLNATPEEAHRFMMMHEQKTQYGKDTPGVPAKPAHLHQIHKTPSKEKINNSSDEIFDSEEVFKLMDQEEATRKAAELAAKIALEKELEEIKSLPKTIEEEMEERASKRPSAEEAKKLFEEGQKATAEMPDIGEFFEAAEKPLEKSWGASFYNSINEIGNGISTVGASITQYTKNIYDNAVNIGNTVYEYFTKKPKK